MKNIDEEYREMKIYQVGMEMKDARWGLSCRWR